MSVIENFEVSPLLQKSNFVRPFRITFQKNGVNRYWDGVKSHDGVSILIFNKDRRSFVFVKQFRPGSFGNFTWLYSIKHRSGYIFMSVNNFSISVMSLISNLFYFQWCIIPVCENSRVRMPLQYQPNLIHQLELMVNQSPFLPQLVKHWNSAPVLSIRPESAWKKLPQMKSLRNVATALNRQG
uniref:Nudix hydrolase domain-containing protein n=1 Tax=Mesocestoides corti TaxID=53468 RepID=A0A5K3F9D5_MESCO